MNNNEPVWKKGWYVERCSAPDYCMLNILFDGEEIASIRKENFSKGKPIIELNESNKKHIIDLDWFAKLLQDINDNFNF